MILKKRRKFKQFDTLNCVTVSSLERWLISLGLTGHKSIQVKYFGIQPLVVSKW